MASGEAMARHLLESVRFSRQYLGAEPSTFLAPDTFGHAGNLPQLAASAGAARYYHHRCNPGQADLWPAYWWEGQDGTRLLAISTPSYNGDIRARDLVETALHSRKHGQTDSLHFHGIGDHGGGPARQNLDALRRFQKHPLAAGFSMQHPGTLHPALARMQVRRCPCSAASRARSSKAVTPPTPISNATTGMAKTCCVPPIRWRLWQGFPADTLQPAWRKFCSTSSMTSWMARESMKHTRKCATDFAEVSSGCRSVTEAALKCAAGGLPAGSLAVTNPLGWERQDWVTVPGWIGTGRGAAGWQPRYTAHWASIRRKGWGLWRVCLPLGRSATRLKSSRCWWMIRCTAEKAFAPFDNREANFLSDNSAGTSLL